MHNDEAADTKPDAVSQYCSIAINSVYFSLFFSFFFFSFFFFLFLLSLLFSFFFSFSFVFEFAGGFFSRLILFPTHKNNAETAHTELTLVKKQTTIRN